MNILNLKCFSILHLYKSLVTMKIISLYTYHREASSFFAVHATRCPDTCPRALQSHLSRSKISGSNLLLSATARSRRSMSWLPHSVALLNYLAMSPARFYALFGLSTISSGAPCRRPVSSWTILYEQLGPKNVRRRARPMIRGEGAILSRATPQGTTGRFGASTFTLLTERRLRFRPSFLRWGSFI